MNDAIKNQPRKVIIEETESGHFLITMPGGWAVVPDVKSAVAKARRYLDENLRREQEARIRRRLVR